MRRFCSALAVGLLLATSAPSEVSGLSPPEENTPLVTFSYSTLESGSVAKAVFEPVSHQHQVIEAYVAVHVASGLAPPQSVFVMNSRTETSTSSGLVAYDEIERLNYEDTLIAQCITDAGPRRADHRQ